MNFLDTNGLKTLIIEIKDYVTSKLTNLQTNFKKTIGADVGDTFINADNTGSSFYVKEKQNAVEAVLTLDEQLYNTTATANDAKEGLSDIESSVTNLQTNFKKTIGADVGDTFINVNNTGSSFYVREKQNAVEAVLTLDEQLYNTTATANDAKEGLSDIKSSVTKIVTLNMDFSTGSGTLTTDEISQLNDTEYPNKLVKIKGVYSPSLAQGVNLLGGDDYYSFETYSTYTAWSSGCSLYVQGSLIDPAGAFPGILAYTVSIDLDAGTWYCGTGGVKIF